MRDLEARFRSGAWSPARAVTRPFVRHVHPDASPAQVWRDLPEGADVGLSVVIPTVDAERGGYFAALLRQMTAQRFLAYEVIVIKGDPRQGRAINTGAAMAAGRYLLTLDDDTSLPDPEAFGKLVAVLDRHEDIGMVGGNNIVPPDATPFVRRAMSQIPRRSWVPVRAITDSDLAEHPCLMMRTEQFRSLGGEHELLPRGLDPYLRQRFREAGLRVVLAPDVVYHHLPPASWPTLLRQFFRNGEQAAFVNRRFPEMVIETPSGHGAFEPRVPLPRRVVRYAGNLLGSLVTGRWVWLACQLWYAAGFVRGWLASGERRGRDRPLAGGAGSR